MSLKSEIASNKVHKYMYTHAQMPNFFMKVVVKILWWNTEIILYRATNISRVWLYETTAIKKDITPVWKDSIRNVVCLVH